MRSADLSPGGGETEAPPPSLDQWLEKKAWEIGGLPEGPGGLCRGAGPGKMSVGLFFLLPMVIGGLFDRWITSNLGINLLEGVIRMGIFFQHVSDFPHEGYAPLFSYHGAEHRPSAAMRRSCPSPWKTVRRQTRLHPRCGTSFLLVVMVLSILIFSIASSALLALAPGLEALRGASCSGL